MPFYEYQCKSCGHHLETMQKVNDPPLRKCPECGKSHLTRLMSAPVFRLKGGGWYETDFKGDHDAKRNLADRPEAAPPADEKKPSTEPADSGSKDKPAAAEKAADKGTEKPAPKPAATESAAPRAAGPSKRGVPAPKSRVKKAVKKTVPKAKRRA